MQHVIACRGGCACEEKRRRGHPAHIDRESNGIIAILGAMPEKPEFHSVEFNDEGNIAAYTEKYGLHGKKAVASSDAHRLCDIADGGFEIELDCTDDPQDVRNALIRALGGEEK
jgi:hypothetical protein